jgi:uncharacterized protein YcnI
MNQNEGERMSIMKREFTSARFGLVALIGVVWASAALAHVSLEVGEAPVGSYYKAVLKVPHGCEGAATTELHIGIPEGILAVKPMPKPGWDIESDKGAYGRSFAFHGKSVTEGVTGLTWKGGELPDEEYDEFVFAVYLASELAPGTTLYLPVTQTCGDKSQGWTEIPKKTPPEDVELPAPSLTLLPARKK